MVTRRRADAVRGRDVFVLTTFFKFYAAAKSILNAARGKKGATRFDGWEAM